MNDDAKKKILARRAKFVAAAIAGLGVACGKQKTENKSDPTACLTPIVIEDAGMDVRSVPRACLSPPATRADAGPCNCQPGDPLCTCR